MRLPFRASHPLPVILIFRNSFFLILLVTRICLFPFKYSLTGFIVFFYTGWRMGTWKEAIGNRSANDQYHLLQSPDYFSTEPSKLSDSYKLSNFLNYWSNCNLEVGTGSKIGSSCNNSIHTGLGIFCHIVEFNSTCCQNFYLGWMGKFYYFCHLGGW